MRLYDYYRSSAAYRCRIALNLKGLAYDSVPVHLREGAQRSEDYRAINPQGLVPALTLDGGVLTQSLAIVEYLEETHPNPPLLPAQPAARAAVRAFALAIACDIHPLNNTRVLQYLRRDLGQQEESVNRWYRHWVEQGLAACEVLLARVGRRGEFCFGETPGLAEICLVPQLYNARRFDCDLSACPTLLQIDAACAELPAFAEALPEAQPDAE